MADVAFSSVADVAVADVCPPFPCDVPTDISVSVYLFHLLLFEIVYSNVHPFLYRLLCHLFVITKEKTVQILQQTQYLSFFCNYQTAG